jgi:protein phosphatase-4 regulatory subunit 3
MSHPSQLLFLTPSNFVEPFILIFFSTVFLFGSTLVKEGLFDIVKTIFESSDESFRLIGCDILIVVLNHDPVLLRTFLVHQPQHTLFSELVAGMLTPSEGGLQAQLLEIMRMLLDSETMDTVCVHFTHIF